MSRYVTIVSWDEVPHLSQEAKDELWGSVQPYQRAARSKGIPSLGAGVIYPFDEDTLKFSAGLVIPRHWPRCFGLDADAGAGTTGVIWLAHDRETGTLYLYDCYKSVAREIAVHVDAIHRRGKWMAGVGDAKSLVVTEYDSTQLIKLYQDSGVDIEHPDKAVEAGIQDVYDLMAAGKFKVRETCTAWFDEQRLYRRNERGQIIKEHDHLMDATRYAIRSGLQRAKVEPEKKEEKPELVYDLGNAGMGWMA